MIYNTAKITPEGQLTLPIDVREKMSISNGDRLAVICESDRIIIMNPAVYAMEKLQKEMEGEWEKAGVFSENDAMKLCDEIRAELNSEGQYG